MPRGKTPRDSVVVSLWAITPVVEMSSKKGPSAQASAVPPALSIMQNYMEKFLADIRQEIGSLQTDFKSCLNDFRRDVTVVGERLDDLECTMDSHVVDREVLLK
ncbi:hypothetical protein NDU88_005756 [Pleurodeles waltl]|uniref:Uncharacterized protein n=1 Tax=Pleurodeles waltl TaxID=8319 RepID=A0AAV7QLK6_PLEWA|nr:hypothetical protein NDU88_005756 [Pleurodeles waltl]